MLDIIKRILHDYGDGALENMQRANAILLDLAPDMRRERILIRSFVELDGYGVLKSSAESYQLAEKKLVQGLVETFAMERTAALWVVRLFASAMGYLDEGDISENTPASETAARMTAEECPQGQVAIGKSHVVAVSSDGTVFAGGDNSDYQCDVVRFRDIVAVAAGDNHTLGLRADGTVLAAGSNAFDQCDINDLTGVAGVYAFGFDSVCVMKDGTAVSVGRSKWDLSFFADIVSVAPYPEGIIGIKKDGTIVLAAYAAEDEIIHEKTWLLSRTDVSHVVSTYVNGSIVLTRAGKLFKSGMPDNYFAQWSGVASIVNLSDGFAVLLKDGTVRVLPYERDLPRIATTADNWRDITAIYGWYKRLIGLSADGGLHVAYTHLGWLWSNKAMAMDYVTGWYPVGVING